MKEETREYFRQYQREHRQWAKQMHICPACKTSDERTRSGKTYCEKCAERYRGYYRREHGRKAEA